MTQHGVDYLFDQYEADLLWVIRGLYLTCLSHFNYTGDKPK